MKRKINSIESFATKEQKTEKIHPLSLVFNYIKDPYEFYNASLVSKEWQKILDNHEYWKQLNEHLEF